MAVGSRNALASLALAASLMACGRAELAEPADQEASIPECTPGSPDFVFPLLGDWGSVKQLAADSAGVYAMLRDAERSTHSVVMVPSRARYAHTLVGGTLGFALQGEFLLAVIDGELVRVSVSSGDSATLAKVGSNPVGTPVVGGERIAMTRGGPKYELLVFDAPGAAPRVLPMPMPKSDYVRKLLLQGDSAFLLSQSVWQMSLLDGDAKILVTDAADWRDFEVTESGLYALQSEKASMPANAPLDPTTFVRRLPLEGGQAQDVAVSAGVGERIWIDYEHVYWSAREHEFWARDGWVFRAPVGGGTAQQVLAGVVTDARVAQNQSCIFVAWGRAIVRHSK